MMCAAQFASRTFGSGPFFRDCAGRLRLVGDRFSRRGAVERRPVAEGVAHVVGEFFHTRSGPGPATSRSCAPGWPPMSLACRAQTMCLRPGNAAPRISSGYWPLACFSQRALPRFALAVDVARSSFRPPQLGLHLRRTHKLKSAQHAGPGIALQISRWSPSGCHAQARRVTWIAAHQFVGCGPRVPVVLVKPVMALCRAFSSNVHPRPSAPVSLAFIRPILGQLRPS